MSYPGAGCGRGGSTATLMVTGAGALAAWWAFENLVAVVVVVALSYVLSVAAVAWLARLTQKREARVGLKLAEWRHAELPAPDRGPELPAPERRALAGDLHLHFHGLPDTAAAAAIIRQAVSAQAVSAEVIAEVSDGDEHLPALPAAVADEPAGRPDALASVLASKHG